MALFQETKTRSAVKTVLWRVIATLITWGTLYYFTGQLFESSKITIVAAIIGMAVYYLYERAWNNIDWGRVKL